jgi:hypothetical protein
LRRPQIQTRAWQSASASDIRIRTHIHTRTITAAGIHIITDRRSISARHFIGTTVTASITIGATFITDAGTKPTISRRFEAGWEEIPAGFYFFGEVDVGADGDVAGDVS